MEKEKKENNINEEFKEDDSSKNVLNYSNKRKKFKNKFNSFLNANFQYLFFLLLFFVFWFSFEYIILPKYEKITVSSAEVLEERKKLFASEYKGLIDYKEAISFFDSINYSDIDKMDKMIPERYSREDLFVEFSYFLMKNNFNIKDIKISDIESSSANIQSTSSRRINISIEDNDISRSYQSLSSIPPNVGAWLIKAEIVNVSYPDLKYLLDIIENNLKLIDIVYIDFDPSLNTVKFDALTYYKK